MIFPCTHYDCSKGNANGRYISNLLNLRYIINSGVSKCVY